MQLVAAVAAASPVLDAAAPSPGTSPGAGVFGPGAVAAAAAAIELQARTAVQKVTRAQARYASLSPEAATMHNRLANLSNKKLSLVWQIRTLNSVQPRASSS